MGFELPCAVLYEPNVPASLTRSSPTVALLLEWKRVVDERGVGSWEGLIVWALPGVGRAGSWELRQHWVPSYKLTPIGKPPAPDEARAVQAAVSGRPQVRANY